MVFHIHICRVFLHTELVTLSLTLNGCETWSASLEEVSILRVFENNVLRRIYRLIQTYLFFCNLPPVMPCIHENWSLRYGLF